MPDHDERVAGGTDAWIERAFDGDRERLERFVGILRAAIPPEVAIGLRGSAVAGSSYETGAPFDADGPGTSDLDVVLIGDAALDLWVDDARVAGMNTTPLSDKAPDIAPSLEPARREAQRLVGRPVSIQAMRSWFLDLRVAVQGQPYVVLSDGT
jgi:hypothetical protein